MTLFDLFNVGPVDFVIGDRNAVSKILDRPDGVKPVFASELAILVKSDFLKQPLMLDPLAIGRAVKISIQSPQPPLEVDAAGQIGDGRHEIKSPSD